MATFNLEELETQIILPCRLCANNSDKIIGIYSSEGISNDLPNKMNQHLPIQVSETDTLPLQCCLNCASTLLAWHEFSISCAEAERKLQEIQTIELKVLDEETEYQEEHIETEDIELDADIDVRDDGGSSQEECDSNPLAATPKTTNNTITNKSFFCNTCSHSFKSKRNLTIHIATHLNLRTYQCPICNKGFNKKTILTVHLKTHKETREYICDVCGKSFKQNASLYVHKKFHSDEMKFECNVCGKKYRMANDLKVHGYLHTGHKPFLCDVCGASFRLRHCYRKHLRMHERENSVLKCKVSTFK